MLALGIDIGGTTIKLALLDAGKTVAVRQSPAAYASPTAAVLADHIRAAAAGLPMPDCVGVCLPGLFDETKRSLVASVNLPRLVGVNLDDILSGTGWPRARVVPDAMAAAVDFQQSHRVTGRLLAVSLGTGVGACVLDDGVPLRVSAPGGGFSAGHLGQIDVSSALDHPASASPDGSRGTAESYLGSAALRARLGVPEGSLLPPLDADDPAVAALERLLRIAHAIYRPDAVALLGGVSFAVSHLAERLRLGVADGLTTLARPGWRLAFADDTFHAARGAARLAALATAES